MVDKKIVDLKARSGFVAKVVAAAAAAAGAAVAAHHFGFGLRGFHGIRLVAALLCGGVTVGVGAFMCQRALRRRARMDAIADLLPRYRSRRLEEDFLDEELEGEPVGHLPKGRAEIRAATRALLVSLEDEMRRETPHVRREGRPACRRARLRVAGRSERGRRRVSPRPVTAPS